MVLGLKILLIFAFGIFGGQCLPTSNFSSAPSTTVSDVQRQHPFPHQNVTCNATSPATLSKIEKRSCCCCCKPCCCGCCCPCKCCSCCNPCCCNCCGECTCIKWAPCCCCPCCCGCTGYGRRRMMKFRRSIEIAHLPEISKSRSAKMDEKE